MARIYIMRYGNFSFNPIRGGSGNWLTWYSIADISRCNECKAATGKIYEEDPPQNEHPPRHPNCRCQIGLIKTIVPGTATVNGENGADYYLYYKGTLPPEYITKDEATRLGWTAKKKLKTVIPGKIIGGDIYDNEDSKLPTAPGRIWYEADINYVVHKRSPHRILYSNDGLIFVTYDHYENFFEIDEKTPEIIIEGDKITIK